MVYAVGFVDFIGGFIMVKLSKASKMPGRSWSLQALDTCPGSKKRDGSLVDACSGCYATQGNYRYPNVKAPREHNREDWKRDQWVDDMVSELDNDRYFRWFDSGDVYDVRLAFKIFEVMKRTPWCNHWLPTRMHKFKKFNSVLAEMSELPNVVVRYSSDSITGDTVEGPQTSTIATLDNVPGDALVCEAYQRDGKCGPCRACWSKEVAVVCYIGHGKSMEKNQRNIIARAA